MKLARATRRARGLALLAVAAAAGCGGGGSVRPAATATPAAVVKAVTARAPISDEDQLDGLLFARADAIRARDGTALARTSTGAQQARDRREMAAARPLPIDFVEMAAQVKHVNGNRATLRATTTYGFEGITSHYHKVSTLKAVRTAKGWRVRGDAPTGGEYAPWELGRYTPRQSRHFLALAPRGLDVGSLMGDLEAGRARMRRALPGVSPPRRTLVLVARDDRETEALTKNVRTLSALTAIAESQLSLTGASERVSGVDGQRVFILWRSYGSRGQDDRRMVIAHELTHAALARRTSGRTPAWLVEGIALYASGDRRAGDAGRLLSGAQLRDRSKQAPARAVLSLTSLARHDAMDRLSAVPLSFAYSYASAAAFAIAEKHGRAGLLRLYTAFNSETLHGKEGRALSDRAVRRTFKTSLATLQAEVDAYARAHAD